MDQTSFNTIFARIKGCTFASLDTLTVPSPGYRKRTRGTQVILFTNNKRSGYESMVKRRLEAQGLDPASFDADDLPFGDRIKGTPLILHKGKLYLQAVLIRPGTSEFSIVGGGVINVDDFPFLKGHAYEGYGQGLPPGGRVIVRTYSLESIESITLLGETLATGELVHVAN